ncbi:abortive infection family protein [Stenotrophomonas rhizophila]|uniref:abortive infection family protein n=1 Tax=Stenotrophomonas rhizophila TaxID=216778 RepID=UPI00224B00E1|nr:abortive infection family protein [Stenotrophomonas rhizophila]MCX2921650.1 abortive infection family protein [Stenotrophomonas rhizophila]
MNAVEIEEAISELAIADFEPVEFPFQFLAAFGNNEVTLKRLRKVGSGGTNFSDLPGAVLQRNHIHLAVCEPGRVCETLDALKTSPKNASNKVKLVLTTDGDTLEAEYLATGELLSCSVSELAERFGFFLPFAGTAAPRSWWSRAARPFWAKWGWRSARAMNDLAKKLAKSLDLVPEGIDDQAKGAECIKRILSILNQIAGNLANLRRLYGTGHGKDGKHRGLQPRHARLAVASAVAFVDFVTETYRDRHVKAKPTSTDR